MEIENIVANTVYIKARESELEEVKQRKERLFAGGGQKKGKSKKWKNYLQFPHYLECLAMKDEIDVRYVFVCCFQAEE